MASLWGYLKTIETISPRTIEDEALKDFKIALIGEPEHRSLIREALISAGATSWEREDAANYIREYDKSPETDVASTFVFRLYVAAPGEPIGVRGPNSVPITGTLDEVITGMIEAKPDLAIALARRLPGFRLAASYQIIRDVSRVNAGIALISALPGVLPITGIILPVSSIADTFLLGKNQVVMVMRLAAAFGKKPHYFKQAKEIVGVAGSALGWRTLARELAGFVPAGVGMAIKGVIAYSGTAAIGRAALWYYQHGKMPTEKQVKEAYKESEAEAKEQVTELIRQGEHEKVSTEETPNTAI